MPPAPVRRPLTITAWLLMSSVFLVLSPLLLACAVIASRVSGRPQPVLLARLLIAYFACELGVLLACGALWLASGGGIAIRSRRFQLLHHRLLRWFVHSLARRVLTLLRLQVKPDVSPEVAEALRSDRPLLFFSRHAGPGDTLLLVDLLVQRYGRLPSVVFKDTLAIDPSIDLIGHRLTHAILDRSEGERCEARIQEVASELDGHGVLVLFPEGGNFTKERRRKALRSLWRKGHRQEASAGEAMTHVLPPHPAGALAALRGNPTADVVFSAHTGLGLAAFAGEMWREPPIGKTLKTKMWLAQAADRPADPDQQTRWLYDWWEELDEWVKREGDEGPDEPLTIRAGTRPRYP